MPVHWMSGKQAVSDRVGFKSARNGGGKKSDMLKAIEGGGGEIKKKKKEMHTLKRREGLISG